MYRISFAPEVQDDLNDSNDWYEEQQNGLGNSFLNDYQEAKNRLLNRPESRQIVFDDIRRFGLMIFTSFGIFYSLENNLIMVYAVSHSSQDPDKLFERISRY